MSVSTELQHTGIKAMEQSVFLIVDDDEICLGTVDEITNDPDWCRENREGYGAALAVALSDIVADLAADPSETCKVLAIELR